MGRRIDLIGEVVGCLTVESIAKSRKVKSGSKGYWNCKCSCGESVVKGAPRLMRALSGYVSTPKYCSIDCKLRNETLVCDCGNKTSVPVFRANRIRKSVGEWRCKPCAMKVAGLKNRGRIASNRLPNAGGGFNSLFNVYAKRAREQNLAFNFSKELFSSMTKCVCHYCGSEPTAEKWANGDTGKRAGIPPYIYNGIDRIDSNKGYEVGNILTCCKVCNYMKLDHSYDFFMGHIEKINAHMAVKQKP